MRIASFIILAALLTGACVQSPSARWTQKSSAVTVQVLWPNAGVSRVTREIAEKLEPALARLRGVERVVTRCDANGCTFTLWHTNTVALDAVLFDAHSAVQQMKGMLPADAHFTIVASDLNAPPDLTVALFLDSPPQNEEQETALHDFCNEIMQFPSASRYQILGSARRETIIEIDPEKAATLRINTDRVAELLKSRIAVIDEYSSVLVYERRDEQNVADMVIGNAGQALVRVRDVARVTEQYSPCPVYRINSKPVVIVQIYLRSDASAEEKEQCMAHVLRQRRPENIRRIIELADFSSRQ